MKSNRYSGILLHPTSLPGPDGIGDLGPEAYRWIDFLAKAGCGLWQVLPLGPTGYGDSPYQCFSAFAGNPFLVSPARLLEDGLLKRIDLADRPAFPTARVEFGDVIQWKLCLLDRAYEHYQDTAASQIRAEFEAFQQREVSWLPDFALFMAIKENQGSHAWNNWPAALRKRETAALRSFREMYADSIQRHAFRQYLFFKQWKALKDYTNSKGIQIIGDIPIYVAYDSADAWSHPELFYFDSKGLPTVVAGVPPDYFSPTGQLWGNPLYHWDIHKNTGYAWWIERIKATLSTIDIIRLDHFRGFAGYWEVTADKPTAEIGRWIPGPGADFFNVVQQALGKLPIIAEDLGEITPDVVELRDAFRLPGMKIFQFAFASDPDDAFLPHNYPVNCVAYTGTHDNDTALGWYESAPDKERDFFRRYLGRSGDDVSWDMIRAVWSSVASMALAPLQDLLKLDTSARMNFPSKPSGNWSWRCPPDALSPQLLERIREQNRLYSRLNKTVEQEAVKNPAG
jgi:4-alpha-glucanotransferase